MCIVVKKIAPQRVCFRKISVKKICCSLHGGKEFALSGFRLGVLCHRAALLQVILYSFHTVLNFCVSDNGPDMTISHSWSVTDSMCTSHLVRLIAFGVDNLQLHLRCETDRRLELRLPAGGASRAKEVPPGIARFPELGDAVESEV